MNRFRRIRTEFGAKALLRTTRLLAGLLGLALFDLVEQTGHGGHTSKAGIKSARRGEVVRDDLERNRRV